MDVDNRHPMDAIDAERVLANVSNRLFAAQEQSRVGRFVLLDKLGSGGMGVVYSAFDPKLDRRVAIKVLHRGDGDAESSHERLLGEARALAKLSHPNVVTIYEVGAVEEQVFLAMELVDGQSAEEWLSQERGFAEVVEVFALAGRGLAAAHAQGLVHRDFKPSNVIVGDDGRVIVLDFGLARTVEVPITLDSARVRAGVSAPLGLTDTRAVVGTPLYMSPEQFDGATVRHSSDQFSFCVALFEALFGERPFLGTTMTELAAQVHSGDVSVPRRKGEVPQWLFEVVTRGLRPRPADRFPSMDALLKALEGSPRRWWQRRSLWAATTGAGVVGALTFLLPAESSEQSCTGGSDKVSEVWNDARRSTMKTAFDESELPYAADAYLGAAQSLDEYAQAWSLAYHDACAATQVRGEQSEALLDRRMVCLNNRLASVDGLAEVLSEADDTVVRNAVSAAHRLPSLAGCADVASLLADESHLDVDAQVRRDRWGRAIARAVSKREAGKYPVAQEEVEAILAELETHDDLSVRARARIELAILLERGGKHEEAAELLKAALSDALVDGNLKMQARAAAKLVTVVGWQLRQTDSGRDWADLARAFVTRMGNPPEAVAVLESAVANVFYSDGDFASAVEHKARALEIQERLRRPDDVRLGTLHSNLGTFHGELGEIAESLVHHRRAVEIREEALGLNHPQTAMAYSSLAGQLRMNGDFEASLKLFEKALAIFENATDDKNNAKVAMVQNNLASTLAASGRGAEALPRYREAIRIWESGGKAHEVRVAAARTNVGSVFLDAERYEEAIEELTKALAIYERRLGPEHSDTVPLHINVSIALRELGNTDEAVREAEVALRVLLASRSREHSLYPQAQTVLGVALGSAGRLDDGIAALEEALEMFGRTEASALAFADAEFGLAELLDARGGASDRERSLEFARSALRRLVKTKTAKGRIKRLEGWLEARGAKR